MFRFVSFDPLRRAGLPATRHLEAYRRTEGGDGFHSNVSRGCGRWRLFEFDRPVGSEGRRRVGLDLTACLRA